MIYLNLYHQREGEIELQGTLQFCLNLDACRQFVQIFLHVHPVFIRINAPGMNQI